MGLRGVQEFAEVGGRRACVARVAVVVMVGVRWAIRFWLLGRRVGERREGGRGGRTEGGVEHGFDDGGVEGFVRVDARVARVHCLGGRVRQLGLMDGVEGEDFVEGARAAQDVVRQSPQLWEVLGRDHDRAGSWTKDFVSEESELFTTWQYSRPEVVI